MKVLLCMFVYFLCMYSNKRYSQITSWPGHNAIYVLKVLLKEQRHSSVYVINWKLNAFVTRFQICKSS